MMLPRFFYVCQSDDSDNATVYLSPIQGDEVRIRAEVWAGVADSVTLHGRAFGYPGCGPVTVTLPE